MGTLYRNGRPYGASIQNITKVSQLENDSNFQTDSQVSETINNTVSPLQSDIENIQKLIPSQATENNQLADKDFVNSSISSNTANFINTFDSIAERDDYTTQHSSEFTPNDYCFVATPTETNILYIRYKWSYNDVSKVYEWKEEYQLNNSGFTAEQWNTINSGITSTDKTTWDNKQDKLVSGTNIKTINGSSILGSGDIEIQNDDKLNIDGSNGTFNGVSTLINKLTTGDSDPTDNDYFISQYVNGGTTNITYHRRPIVKLWNYIKSKMRLLSGDKDNETHDCNLALTNGFYYYTSNGPSTSIGASVTEGSLYVQRYNDTWISQIAQDYRNGRLFVRSKNNGTWTSWTRVMNHGDNPIKIGDCTLQYNSTTKSLDFIFN